MNKYNIGDRVNVRHDNPYYCSRGTIKHISCQLGPNGEYAYSILIHEQGEPMITMWERDIISKIEEPKE